MKVGFLLGTFDPIHMGHLYMITSALNDNLVDEVVVVPTMQNVWKDHKATDFQHRCFMTQLAIDETNNCTISSIDYYTPEPHYSYQTLQLLKEEYPDEELYLIVGGVVIQSKFTKAVQAFLPLYSLALITSLYSTFGNSST